MEWAELAWAEELLSAAPGPVPLAFALGIATAAIPLDQVMTGFFQSMVSHMISAALRLIRLGQTAGQRIQMHLEPSVIRAVNAAIHRPAGDVGTATPMLELCSILHETQYNEVIPFMSSVLRIGVGGPVGSGKTALMAQALQSHARRVRHRRHHQRHLYAGGCGISHPQRRAGARAHSRGGNRRLPAHRDPEDASINLIAVDQMMKKFPALDAILIESGGDNLSATFSPNLRITIM